MIYAFNAITKIIIMNWGQVTKEQMKIQHM